MKLFEVRYELKCMVPFTAKDRQAAVTWASRIGIAEIAARRDDKGDKIVVVSVDEVEA